LKNYLWLAIVIIVVVIIFIVSGVGDSSGKLPTAEVRRGDFVISLSENGRLAAKRSVTVSAPRIRGNLQIIKLAEEGIQVEKGDFLAQFDPSEQETRLREAESELKIARANLEKAKAQYDMDIMQLELELKKATRTYSEKLSEAPVIRKEAELEMELAELKYESQKKALKAEIEKMEVEVDKALDKKESATRDLEKMTLTAPIPGLVVYLEIWKGGSMSKLQEGDSPWGGQGIIELPDLSTMIVNTAVSEVDVAKVKLEQKAEISLDAVPGPVFTGTVTDISTLAHPKSRGSQINVFDVEIEIDSADDRLKPGMSAKAEIIIDTYEDVLSVPIEAVFERDDTTVVYNKSGDKIEVAVGARNDQAVIITSGLEEGDEISLVDPHRKIEEIEDSQKDVAPQRKPSGQPSSSEVMIIGG